MKRTLLLPFLFLSITAFAQKEANFWYYGQGAGIDFSSGNAVALTNGALITAEGCATISDASGNLLFYTDGITVWDKTHFSMANGTGLNGDISSSQSALIVPKPGSTTIYYIFTAAADGNSNGIQYSELDMTLNTGLGDVLTKNTPLLTPATERLTAMKPSGGSKYWVAVHEWGTNAFYVYPVTSTGIGTPVVTNIGIKHNTSKIQNTYGQMKFSPCGDKLALACGYLDTVQVFDFNDVTGVISNPLTLSYTSHVFGCEFSGDGKRLYISTYDPSATLVQYDLTLGSATAIKNSKTVLSTTVDIYGMQLANNGKIYVDRSYSSWIGVINSPGTAGTGCNYVDNGVNVDPNSTGINSGLTLPGFVQSLLKESACDFTGLAGDNTEEPLYEVFPNPYTEKIFLKSLSSASAEVNITNLQGQEVFRTSLKGGGELYPGNLAKGIYFLNVTSGKEQTHFRIVNSGSN